MYTAEVLAVVCPTCKGVGRCIEPNMWGSKFIDTPHAERVALTVKPKPLDRDAGGFQEPS